VSAEDELFTTASERVGSVLAGKWHLDALLGVGGMAAVYAATHRNGATAAVKLLHGRHALDAQFRERFLREAYIANKVEHAGVAKVLDDDQTPDGELYLVMELLRGESVEALANRRGGRLALGEALAITDHALKVLTAAHAAGVVHRDLTPTNLFLTETGQLKLLDFGIARLRDDPDAPRRTRSGVLMGTPAFMAPEQALGRWDDVDARTDLWALGAVVFTLVTGRAVHEAPTANEMLILAATRAAPSLARFCEAPLGVVRFVDRALEFDRDRRFADAATMRAELRRALPELGDKAPRVSQRPSAAPRNASAPPLVLVPSAPPVPILTRSPSAPPLPAGDRPPELRGSSAPPALRRVDLDAVDLYDPSFASEEDVAAMQELFTLVERALVSSVQYGNGHPEAARRMQRAFERCAEALQRTDTALVFNVAPYAFVTDRHSIWEPRNPFDRIPYQLFADGVRSMGLLPGLDQAEFDALLGILVLDRTRDLAPEDDFVTLLWDAGFQHVIYQAIDAFSEGDQTARGAFERDVGKVIALAQFDTSFQLEDCWQEQRAAPRSAEERERRLIALITGAEPVDAESLARADAVGERLGDAEPLPALEVAAPLVRVFGARMALGSIELGDRFVAALAAGYCEAAREGVPRSVTVPLRSALDGLSRAAPAAAVELTGSLCEALSVEAEAADLELLRGSLVGAVVSDAAMQAMLDGSLGAGADRELYARGLRIILQYADDSHVAALLGALTRLPAGEIEDLAISYLARTGRGHEAEMGALFADASLDLGLSLIRVLARIGTPEARDAIVQASASRHAVVRIEALGHVEGASSERLRLELRALLEDREPDVRIAALRAMRDHGIRVAGPFLVLRIRSPQFDKLPPEERRQALATLCGLAPARAEAVCLELLKEGRVMTSDSHEETRALAAEALGYVAVGNEALEALGAASTSRWRNSERVRASAGRAREQAEIRLSSAPPRSRS
jgi:eukaryotic-like serine/threonine-protein kinase